MIHKCWSFLWQPQSRWAGDVWYLYVSECPCVCTRNSLLLTGSEHWKGAMTIEPLQCGLTQLCSACSWHHSIEWLKERLDNDAELEWMTVKDQLHYKVRQMQFCLNNHTHCTNMHVCSFYFTTSICGLLNLKSIQLNKYCYLKYDSEIYLSPLAKT